MKVTVFMTTTASLSVEVEVPDGLDPDEAKERAIEQAYEDMPGDICAQCSGWDRTWSRELGDDWEPCADDPVHIHE